MAKSFKDFYKLTEQEEAILKEFRAFDERRMRDSFAAERINPKWKIAIVFDGRSWHVRRIRVIEHDLNCDEKVYRCDKVIGSDYASLLEVPIIREAIALEGANADLDSSRRGAATRGGRGQC